MHKLAVALLLLLPLAVHADDAGSVPPAQSTTQSSSNSSLQQTGSASDSAPQTLNLLQPAGADTSSTSLQPADAANGGVSQSTTQDVSQTGTATQTTLLVQGDADGPQQSGANQTANWLGYVVLILIGLCIVVGAVWVWRRPRA